MRKWEADEAKGELKANIYELKAKYIVYQCVFCLIRLVYQNVVVHNILGYLRSAKGHRDFDGLRASTLVIPALTNNNICRVF